MKTVSFKGNEGVCYLTKVDHVDFRLVNCLLYNEKEVDSLSANQPLRFVNLEIQIYIR